MSEAPPRNRRPPKHRPLHFRTERQRIATLDRFQVLRGPRQSAWRRGYDAEWSELRAQHLLREPMCGRCADRGVVRQAKVVDHIESIKQRPELRLVDTNLQSPCWPCHNAKTNRYDGGFGNKRG
jgi:5-methylcytosine-specific restriction protein A